MKGGGHIYRIIWRGTSIETGKIGREGFVAHWRVNLVGFHSQQWRGGGIDDAYSNSCFVLMCFLVAPPADTLTLGPPASPAQKASLCHCGPDVTLTFLFLFATSWIKPTFLFLFLFSSGCFYRTGPRKDAWLHTNIRKKHLCWIFCSWKISGCINQCWYYSISCLDYPKI